VIITTTFRARYEGGCAASNEHTIRPGDLVGWTDDDQVVCSQCVKEATDAEVD
jgi:hypothetical protein